MEKRVVLALILSMMVIIGYQYFFVPKPEAPQHEVATDTRDLKPSKEGRPSKSLDQIRPSTGLPVQNITNITLPEGYTPKRIAVDTPFYKAVFSELGGKLISFKLKRYTQDLSKNSPLLDLYEGFEEGMGSFLVATGSPHQPVNLNIPMQANVDSLDLENNDQGELTFKGVLPNGLVLTKTFRFSHDSYLIKMDITLENPKEALISDYLLVSLFNFASKDKSRYSFEGPVVYDGQKINRIKAKKLKDHPFFEGNIKWYGYEYKYFLTIVTDGLAGSRVIISPLKNDKDSSDAMLLWSSPPLSLAPGDKLDFTFNVFMGPKDLSILKDMGHDLDKMVNFGWFDVIAKPLLWTLKFFNSFTHNYGVAIILLTILIKILFWPLTHKSTISMQRMQKLQPLMVKIREKYKDNRQAMNQELMNLYKTYKVNPMSGCLPILLQIPVFFALYKVLLNDITLRHAPFIRHLPFTDIVWLADLSAKDPYYITPILMGASMFLQQKTMPTPGDPTQAKIMLLMPIIFTFFFLNFPSGLVLYWMVNNILSIGQQYYIKHKATD